MLPTIIAKRISSAAEMSVSVKIVFIVLCLLVHYFIDDRDVVSTEKLICYTIEVISYRVTDDQRVALDVERMLTILRADISRLLFWYI